MKTFDVRAAESTNRTYSLAYTVYGEGKTRLGSYVVDYHMGAIGPHVTQAKDSDTGRLVDTVNEYNNVDPYGAFLAVWTPTGKLIAA